MTDIDHPFSPGDRFRNKSAGPSRSKFYAVLGSDATPEMIGQCVQLDAAVFDPNTCATLSQCLAWWEHNPDIYILLMHSSDRTVVGYLNHMAVSQEVAEQTLMGTIIDPEIACEDILVPTMPGLYRLFLCSIVVARPFRHSAALRALCDAFTARIYDLSKQDIYFSEILSDAFTLEGRQICAHVGMRSVGTSAHGSIVFKMNMIPPEFTPITSLQRRIYDRYLKKATDLSRYKIPGLTTNGYDVALARISPELRELDLAIAQVEISIRTLIDSTLQGDKSQLPTNIRPAVEERIRREIKANAAFNLTYHQTLSGMLEFFDLRELQSTIENKILWPRFQPRFSSKEALMMRFGQLSTLRNAIRHTRTVDDIVQKDGEAAVYWFNRVLRKRLFDEDKTLPIPAPHHPEDRDF